MVKMKAAEAVKIIVGLMLPMGTADKLLHVAIDIQYMCHPKKKNKDETITIEEAFCVHYIFHRPMNYIRVLRSINHNPFEIKTGDIFRQTAYHDTCWRIEGLERDLDKIHYEIMEKIEKKFKRISGREMTHSETLLQPNCVLIGEAMLINGEIKTTDSAYGLRNYRAEVIGEKTVFTQITG